ncbi:MAG: hypothetical protein DHS20C15_27380 [Planctomycetota bacterium]|nr:MAG: hypothetical protein DHS20C15_27380 [Planctomycetota bacterium]
MPSSHDWDQLKRLFIAARELPRRERAAFIERECDDDALRDEVLELLDQADADTPFMEGSTPRLSLTRSESTEDQITPIPTTPSQLTEPDQEMPESIGPYILREILGRGGMGQVYLAEQHTQLHRLVALKILRSAAPSAQVLARFASERQALAQLNHPGIAQVYDAGSTDDGQPFLAMEYVPGSSITDFCEQHALSGVARLELAAQVCRAIHHSHLRGLLHRDIKPNNILVSVLDGSAQPKVIDFGVAKALAGDGDDSATTRHGQLLGTPEYASPEQLAGDPDIDTRSDVWALGVVIHELLTGALPRDGARLAASASTGLDKPQQRELQLVLECALAVDREERYASAEGLAADLERLVRGEPVGLSPATLSERARRTLRRHRLALATVGVLLIGTLLGLLGLWRGLEEARRSEENARTAEANARSAEANARSDARSAEATVEFLLELFAEAGPSERPVDSVTAGEVLDAATRRLEQDFAGDPRAKARLTAAMAASQLQLSRRSVAVELARSAVEQWMALEPRSPASLHSARLTLAHALAEGLELEAATEQIDAAELEAHELASPRLGRLRITLQRARVARLSGDMLEAADLLDAALAASSADETASPEERRLKSHALMNLGQVLIELARFADAESVLLDAEQALAAYLPEGNNTLLEVRARRGAAMARQGKSNEAEVVLRDALTGLESSLGPDHMALGPPMLALAHLYVGDERSEEAEPIATRLDALIASNLGPDHVDRVVPLSLVGSIAAEQGDFEAALAVIEEAVSIAKAGYGSAHPSTLSLRMSRIEVLTRLGQPGTVADELESVASLARERLGARHQLAVGPVAMRATMLASAGQVQLGMEEVDSALEALGDPPDNAPDVSRALLLATRAALRGQSGRPDKGRADALEARDILTSEGAERGRIHQMATLGVTQVLMRLGEG